MTRYLFLLSGLLLLVALLAITLATPQRPHGDGEMHSTYPSMNTGGTVERHAGRVLLGWLYGGAQLVICVSLMSIGITPRRAGPLVFWGGVYFAVFSLLMLLYARNAGQSQMAWGFTRPTAWMLYVLWPTGFVFAALYVAKFPVWIFSTADREKFAAILAESRGDKETITTQRELDG